ncbi:MAG TPA: ABC transporter ATP-binding protein [Trueperaceae bacterium]
MTGEPLLRVEDLTVALRVDAGLVALIDSVSFSLDSGRVLALVGESGSGKSVTALSLMRLLPNAMRIHEGSINFRSRRAGTVDLAALRPYGREMRSIRGSEIGMIFQEPMASFSPVHTIGEHIADVLRAHTDLNSKAVRERAIEMLDRVQIADPRRAVDRYPHEFSGGMRQRAMIAKALCCGPALLIADEPTTALDVTIQAQVLELMLELQTEFEMAIIFITHDLGVVAQIADEVAVMYTGKLIEQGDKRAVFRQPAHPYTRELLAATPRLGRNGAAELRTIRGNVPGLLDLPSGCTFHPRCDSFIHGCCELHEPEDRYLSEEHRVSCHLYD